jgi:hypothetical protein
MPSTALNRPASPPPPPPVAWLRFLGLGQAAAHRWYVLGLREVLKAVRTRRARCVVLAPNIEEVSCEGGLDAMLATIASM